MNELLLLTGIAFSIGAKLVALGFMMFSYLRNGRRSAFLFGIAFLLALIQVAGDMLNAEWLSALTEALMASTFFYAAVVLIEEELPTPVTTRGYLGVTPVILTVYFLLAEGVSPSLHWLLTVGVAYSISGLFLAFAGGLLWNLRTLYPSHMKLFSVSMILYGLHEMDYPLLRPVAWFAPIGFSISAVLTILLAYGASMFAMSERFKRLEIKEVEIELKPGVTFLPPESYRSFISGIQDFPALAFVRNPDNVSDAWESYLLSNAGGQRSISPTNLPKITELVNVYLRSAKEGGGHGVVLLDGVEYLLVYNGFDSILKFLNNIRDIAMLHGGTVVVPTERRVWDERQWALLERLVS